MYRVLTVHHCTVSCPYRIVPCLGCTAWQARWEPAVSEYHQTNSAYGSLTRTAVGLMTVPPPTDGPDLMASAEEMVATGRSVRGGGRDGGEGREGRGGREGWRATWIISR